MKNSRLRYKTIFILSSRCNWAKLSIIVLFVEPQTCMLRMFIVFWCLNSKLKLAATAHHIISYHLHTLGMSTGTHRKHKIKHITRMWINTLYVGVFYVNSTDSSPRKNNIFIKPELWIAEVWTLLYLSNNLLVQLWPRKKTCYETTTEEAQV